jgi:hypothetical protein
MSVGSAKGDTIIVTTNRTPSGIFREGRVKTGETHYPGMIVQEDRSVAEVEGVATFKIADIDADGTRPKGALFICTEILQIEQGRGIDPANTANGIAAGEHAMYYSPRAGEQLNVIYKNVTGTADDVAAGDILIVDDGTGKLIVTTGSPEIEPFKAMTSLVDPTEDALLWVEYTGY